MRHDIILIRYGHLLYHFVLLIDPRIQHLVLNSRLAQRYPSTLRTISLPSPAPSVRSHTRSHTHLPVPTSLPLCLSLLLHSNLSSPSLSRSSLAVHFHSLHHDPPSSPSQLSFHLQDFVAGTEDEGKFTTAVGTGYEGRVVDHGFRL